MFDFFTPIKANSILSEVKIKFANILMQRKYLMDLQAELDAVVGQEVSHASFFTKKKKLTRQLLNCIKI